MWVLAAISLLTTPVAFALAHEGTSPDAPQGNTVDESQTSPPYSPAEVEAIETETRPNTISDVVDPVAGVVRSIEIYGAPLPASVDTIEDLDRYIVENGGEPLPLDSQEREALRAAASRP